MSPAAFHLAILRSASVVVPEWQRADWLAEWQSELWHARREPCGLNVTAFCMGAFRDAFWLRRDRPNRGNGGGLHLNLPATPAGIESFPDQGVAALSSPIQCLSWLAGLGALCLALGLVIPGSRAVLVTSLYPGNLVLLNPAYDGGPEIANGFLDPYPSVSRQQFESLQARPAQFTGLAFYVPMRMPVDTPNGKRTLFIAKTSPELFRLLNIPVQRGHSGAPELVLTHTAWRKYFNGDPRYGVVADERWNLPAAVDGWLIEDESALATLPALTEGFALGRLRYKTLHDSRFHFIRLRDRSFDLLFMAVPACVFACILFSIMPFGSTGGHPLRIGARRGLFLAAKALLTLPIIAFGSLDLTNFGVSTLPLIYNVVMLSGFVAARWIIADQRTRCPVCLRLLANPVRIGGASRILLEWHGTESMCTRGHGLLYVPEWPAIWSGRQRWMKLDQSWSSLFPEAQKNSGEAVTNPV